MCARFSQHPLCVCIRVHIHGCTCIVVLYLYARVVHSLQAIGSLFCARFSTARASVSFSFVFIFLVLFSTFCCLLYFVIHGTHLCVYVYLFVCVEAKHAYVAPNIRLVFTLICNVAGWMDKYVCHWNSPLQLMSFESFVLCYGAMI